jgi:hypothetical protein
MERSGSVTTHLDEADRQANVAEATIAPEGVTNRKPPPGQSPKPALSR